MIIEKEHDDQYASTFEHKKAFTIKATAKSFSILSKNLYRNSIRAGIRELCCNAIDAHIDNKNSDPFNIHLPTIFEPTFYVEDFGVGMTTEQLEDVFTTYFDSTKTGDNDRIGGLGLGSKSPFAYTTQYTIETSKNGIKTIALAYLDGDHMPNLSIVTTENCEQSGTKVSYAVNPDDIEKFTQEAINVLITLDVMPNIVGGKEDFFDAIHNKSGMRFSKEPVETRFAQVREEIRNGLTSGNQDLERAARNMLHNAQGENSPSLIMGGVCYSIATNEIFNEFEYSNLFKSIFRQKFVVATANIGDVSIQPSREALLYDDKTKSYFKNLIMKFIYETVMRCFQEKQSLMETYSVLMENDFGKEIIEPLLLHKAEHITFETVQKTFANNFGDLFTDDDINKILIFVNDIRSINNMFFELAVKGHRPWLQLQRTWRTFNINGTNYDKISITSASMPVMNMKTANYIHDIFRLIRDHNDPSKFSDATPEFFAKVVQRVGCDTSVRQIVQVYHSIRSMNEHEKLRTGFSKIAQKVYGTDLGNRQVARFILVNPLFNKIFKLLDIEMDLGYEGVNPLIQFPKREKSEKTNDWANKKILQKWLNGTGMASENDLKGKSIYYIVTDAYGSAGYFHESTPSAKMNYSDSFVKHTQLTESIKTIEDFLEKNKATFGFTNNKQIVKIKYGDFKAAKIKENKRFKNFYREYFAYLKKHFEDYASLFNSRITKDSFGTYMHVRKNLMTAYETKFPEIKDTMFYTNWLEYQKNKDTELSNWCMTNYRQALVRFFSVIQSANAFNGIVNDDVVTFKEKASALKAEEHIDLNKNICNRYPMLEFANSYSYDDKQYEKFLDYVLFVEKQYAQLQSANTQAA